MVILNLTGQSATPAQRERGVIELRQEDRDFLEVLLKGEGPDAIEDLVLFASTYDYSPNDDDCGMYANAALIDGPRSQLIPLKRALRRQGFLTYTPEELA